MYVHQLLCRRTGGNGELREKIKSGILTPAGVARMDAPAQQALPILEARVRFEAARNGDVARARWMGN